MTNLIVIEYTQSITYDESNQPKEMVFVSVRLTYEAFSSGWIKENFRGRSGPTDFLVLTGIANHARPLHGDDLQQMIDLDVATQVDKGRLYARITNVGLADELGMERETVGDAARRLAEKGLIRICPLPENFRDSRGQFGGNKAYIIAGTFVTKQYDDDRAGLTRTVTRQNGNNRAGLTDINIDDDDDDDEILLKFMDLLIEPRPATPRERQQLRTLLDEGYTRRQIGEAIDAVFQRQDADHPIRQFGRVMTYMHKHIPQPTSSGTTSGRQHTELFEVSDATQTVDRAVPVNTTRCDVAVSSDIDAILTQAGYDQANIRLSIHGLISGSDPTLSPPATTYEVVTALWAAIGAGIQTTNLRSYLCTVIRNGRNAPAASTLPPAQSRSGNGRPPERDQPSERANGLTPLTQHELGVWSQVVGHTCIPGDDDIISLPDNMKLALRRAEVGRRSGALVARVEPAIYAAVQPFLTSLERNTPSFFGDSISFIMEEL